MGYEIRGDQPSNPTAPEDLLDKWLGQFPSPEALEPARIRWVAAKSILSVENENPHTSFETTIDPAEGVKDNDSL